MEHLGLVNCCPKSRCFILLCTWNLHLFLTRPSDALSYSSVWAYRLRGNQVREIAFLLQKESRKGIPFVMKNGLIEWKDLKSS
jgi:hypothetical protein